MVSDGILSALRRLVIWFLISLSFSPPPKLESDVIFISSSVIANSHKDVSGLSTRYFTAPLWSLSLLIYSSGYSLRIDVITIPALISPLVIITHAGQVDFLINFSMFDVI